MRTRESIDQMRFSVESDFAILPTKTNPDLLVQRTTENRSRTQARAISSSVRQHHLQPVRFGKALPPLSVDWDNYEAHKAFIDSPSYSALLEKLKPSLGASGKAEMYHVLFSAPTIALEKPATEVCILTLKAPENRATVVDILSTISEATEKAVVFGQTREDDNKYILIGGWPTVEVC